MVADHSNDFQRYPESVGTAYKDWWSLYTLTDAVSKQQVDREKSSSVFDFGLMVQRVKPEQPEKGEAQEKTERLPVLEGLQLRSHYQSKALNFFALRVESVTDEILNLYESCLILV
ncbi:hypothetical protein H6F98_07230 [Microcoleus sp. FACHB-SPT15]|uniref:hypothetical protein n=1 Tax=Microcoleus sp. FACHB-SPT15 TaxID=2692830 RepID=UPI00177AA9D8|nr:hypothetical protein [Microcoleus sp. FACHB-SPT15]MBD1805241.1 hypothetical protein [Microcoleus sp. FACHB-SPT15]